MTKKEFLKIAEDIICREKRLKNETVHAVREMLKSLPDKTLDLTEAPAFALVEATDCWMETQVHGIRLNGDGIEISFERDYREGCGQKASWKTGDTATEHDANVSINWTSIMESVKQNIQ